MVEVVKINEHLRPVGACPKCDQDRFCILLDAYGADFSSIEGFLCVNCGHIIECRIGIIPGEFE
jgi:hypothetical protein